MSLGAELPPSCSFAVSLKSTAQGRSRGEGGQQAGKRMQQMLKDVASNFPFFQRPSLFYGRGLNSCLTESPHQP